MGATRRYSYAQQLKPSNIQHPAYAYRSESSDVQRSTISRCRKETFAVLAGPMLPSLPPSHDLKTLPDHRVFECCFTPLLMMLVVLLA
ncbi:Uhrf1 protein [Pseudozyma hubeiensis SY62]|uniref:Uhrf1 protein n=1 Tax=Pseudozyma hubeiensis (strain SY62) TaxID=1305764 RepID=R9PAM9_PSEHS|nr:Uhrf1 protein [Pseudozyma hubeiensis SY62]GAC98421.1 Uhrf1 protein [Pseudozyma hubeiensis SY62]